TTVVVGLVALVTLGAALSGQVRDSLYDVRVDEVLTDAAVRAETVQSAVDNANAARSEDVRQAVYDVLNSVSSTAGAPPVLLLQIPGQSSAQFPEFVSDNDQRALIQSDLREAVRENDTQMWQAVAIKTAQGWAPGIVVGTTVTLPIAGEHE